MIQNVSLSKKLRNIILSMRYFSVIFCIVLFGLTTNVWAKSVFVNDQLRVGVRPEPSQIVAPVGVVLTGMKLEVLESKDAFIKIRTKDGLEGWIKDIYVTNKIPAILRLKDIEEEQKTFTAKMSEVEKAKLALEEANTILNNQIDVLKAQRAELQRTNAVQIVSNAASSKDSIIFWLALCVVTGFLAGYFWHRHQSMKRLGGLRI